jgi:hypothetical protein
MDDFFNSRLMAYVAWLLLAAREDESEAQESGLSKPMPLGEETGEYLPAEVFGDSVLDEVHRRLAELDDSLDAPSSMDVRAFAKGWMRSSAKRGCYSERFSKLRAILRKGLPIHRC